MKTNEPVAWAYIKDDGFFDAIHPDEHDKYEGMYKTPLYTHPAKPSICVGYWDNKTGAFHKNLTELQQKRVADGFLQAVYTEGMLPAKTLTDEEILQEAENMFGTHFFECIDDPYWIEFARAILRKAQEK